MKPLELEWKDKFAASSLSAGERKALETQLRAEIERVAMEAMGPNGSNLIRKMLPATE